MKAVKCPFCGGGQDFSSPPEVRQEERVSCKLSIMWSDSVAEVLQ